MTEKFNRVNVNELTVVRVTCLACKVTTELDVAQIHKATSSGDCVHCKSPLVPKAEDALRNLKNALRILCESSENVRVEFTIPEKN